MKKKIAVVALLALVAALLFWWVQVRKDLILSEKDLIPVIQRTVGTDAPLAVLEEYTSDKIDDRLVLCYTTEGAGEPRFYAVELHKTRIGYQCHQTFLVERGKDIYVVVWFQGSVFLINNPNAAYIQISRTSPAGETVRIPVTEVPFTYYWNRDEDPWRTEGDGTASYEYLFFDKAGKEIK